MLRCLCFLSFFFLTVGRTAAAEEIKTPALTPIATVKAFFLALANSDQAQIKALAMPNPKLKTLYAKPPTSEERDVLRQTAESELRVLRPGEQVPMDNGMMTVPPSTKIAFVYAPSMSFPLPVHRIDGVWKVNVGPLITAREKAAKETPRHVGEEKIAAKKKPRS